MHTQLFHNTWLSYIISQWGSLSPCLSFLSFKFFTQTSSLEIPFLTQLIPFIWVFHSFLTWILPSEIRVVKYRLCGTDLSSTHYSLEDRWRRHLCFNIIVNTQERVLPAAQLHITPYCWQVTDRLYPESSVGSSNLCFLNPSGVFSILGAMKPTQENVKNVRMWVFFLFFSLSLFPFSLTVLDPN